MMPWLLLEFIWRRKHHADIWGGVIKCLKEVRFSDVYRNPAFVTEVIRDES
jgi:hypothetical protein